MCDLRTLWDINDESFRLMLGSQLGRRHVARPGEEVSPEELAQPMPGDELVAQPDHTPMRAENIHVPASEVWPWLAQMMRGAGIYGWPRLESAACASADRIIGDIPPPRVGDRIGNAFELVMVQPPQCVVWRNTSTITILGLTVRELTLCYQLKPFGDRSVRILARQRCRFSQPIDRLNRRFSNLIHFLLPCSQLRCIKFHAEATAALEAAPLQPRNSEIRFQAAPFRPATV